METKFIDTEETLHIKEKRQAFLLKLSDALRPLGKPVDIEEAVTKIALDFMDADWCHYSTVEEDKLTILRDAVRGDLPSIIGEYKISNFALFKAVLDSGHPIIIDDVHTTEMLDEELKQLCGQLQNIAFIIVPVIKNGKPVGMLSLVQSRARKWMDFEVQLTIETAERTWAAVERAKAEETLRKSEEKYHSLFNSIDAGFCILEVLFNENEMPYDYRFLEANNAFEKQTGLIDAVGKTMKEMVHGNEQYWFDIYGRIAKTGKSERFENEAKALGIYYEVYAFPVGEPEENQVGVLFNDITARKRAEEKLKESENRFRTMADALPVLIWTLDANGLSSYYNKTFRDFLGVSKDAEISDWAPIVHSEDLQFTFDTINTAMAERRSYSLELRLLRADGRWRWVLAQGNPNVGANNEFLGFVGSSVDITERKEVEEKIAESEHRYHNLIYNSPSLIAIFKGENMFIDIANDSILASWGKGKNIIGKSLFSVMPEIVEQGFEKILLSVYNTGEPYHAYETPVTLLRNGINELIYYNFVYQAQRNINGAIEGVAILANEVTPQALLNKKIKESEQEIRKIKEQLELSIRAGKIGVWHWDVKNDLLYWSNEQKAIYGLEPSAELLNVAQYKALVFPEDWDRLNKNLQTAPIIEEQEYDFRIKRKIDGEIRWIKSRARNILDQHGELQFISGVNIDVTEEVLALNKIQESEEKFKRLVTQAPVAICVLRGKDYVIETMNEGMSALWDRTFAQALNKPVFDVLPEARDQGIKELLDNVYFTGERCVIQELSVNIMRNGKLETAFVKFVYEPLREADGTVSGVMALAHEITEQVLVRKRVEESEKKFEAAMQAVEGIIWTNNAKGEMVGEQPGWANLTGQQFEEYQGFGWAKTVHPDDAQPTINAWNDAVNQKNIFEFEHRVLTKDKGWRYFAVKAVPAFDDTGAILQWVGVHTDSTEQKAAIQKIKESEQKFRLLADSMPQHIWTSDPEGNLNYFNQSVYDFSGLSVQQVNSDGWLQIVHPDDRKENIRVWTESISTGKDFLFEHRFKRYDGEYRWQLSRAIPQMGEDGKIQMWVGASTDIQDQKNFTNELEKQVTERTEQIAQNNIELEKMNNELQSFAYISSHDLQEPLRKIQIFSNQILLEESGNLSDAGKDKFIRMKNSAGRMQTLIQDLLTYSRTATAERVFEMGNLEEIVEEVKIEMQEELLQKNAVIDMEADCDFMIIPFQFRQLINNLIGNSLKFVQINQDPHITIKCAKEMGATLKNEKLIANKFYWHIVFADNGIGFEEEYNERIFEVFQRLHGRQEYMGTGIGLAIVKKIVENHSGIIEASGKINNGTTFNIYIPEQIR